MSVYVDNMRAPFGRMMMCHMVADTHEELLAMAATIDVAWVHIQKRGTPQEHFDISLSKRKIAIANGALVVTRRELGLILRAKRVAAMEGGA